MRQIGMRLSRLRNAGLSLFACHALVLANTTNGQKAESHARVELVAEEYAPHTGKPVWVGLVFYLDRGWHIYWHNPGDSGEPPKVQWELPPGWRAGAIRWPTPVKLGSGSVVDYGYEGQVLLMAPIERAAATSNLLTSVEANVSYLVCQEICIPGKAHVTLSFPAAGVTPKRAPGRRSLFEQTRGQLPKPLPAGWKVSVTQQNDHLLLSVHAGSQVRGAKFFPLEAGQIENSAPQAFTMTKAGFRLALRVSDQLARPISALNGVLVLDSGRAFELTAPVISHR
jgi:DsbC/DsbD-like thiol-disulfide interchange protein